MDVDSGIEEIFSRRDLRKPTLFACSLPVHCLRVTLMFLESIPTPVANNKALEALETCMENAVEFNVTFNENKAVDLLFRTKEKQSLCKKLLPMVFEPATRTSPNSPISTLPEKVSLPISPPNTPIAASQPPTVSSIPSEATGAERVKEKFTMDDLNVIPLSCGEKIPLYVLDPSTIMSSESPYITAADYANKEFLAKMEHYLKMVPDYCKSDKSPKKGYAPKKMEICLSIFAEDGEWYRALCVDHKPNETFVVMFLDYGNIAKVNKKDIMSMPKDLMFPSNANTVYIEGITSKEQGLAFLKSIQKSPIIYANVRRLEGEDAYAAKICN